jgi:hypothetical protein
MSQVDRPLVAFNTAGVIVFALSVITGITNSWVPLGLAAIPTLVMVACAWIFWRQRG